MRKWLIIPNRRIFNDTIKRNYKNNIDYKISVNTNFEVISLTPEVSKKISLSTKTIIGRQVKQYYYIIEGIY